MSFPKIKPASVLFPFTEILKWNNVCVVYQSNGLDVINFFLRNYVILAISGMSFTNFYWPEGLSNQLPKMIYYLLTNKWVNPDNLSAVPYMRTK